MINLLAEDIDHVLSHTQEVWEDLRGKRLFITGGTGFFGCWLLESFLWANERLGLGAEVTVLTRSPEAFRKKAPRLASNAAVRLLAGDIRSFDFPQGAFSHIIHAATEAGVKSGDKSLLSEMDTITQGTRRVLDFAVHCGAKKFLLTSSGAVYGKQPPDVTHVSEDYAGSPNTMDIRSVYGEGKRFSELLCAIYAQEHGIETKIARGFAFVGPYLPLDAHFAIGNFIRDGMKGGPIQVSGDGTPYRSYLYAADLAIWLWTILVNGTTCREYNVGSEDSLTIARLARKVADVLGSGVEVVVAQQPAPGVPPARYAPSTQRARTELGLDCWIGLEESIRRTVAWNKSIHNL
ncbi:MAG: NAD-dependent epimerase/dehydratase family protein [Armatimonadota bacterium]|nr:NAD-dependent epimerase/dehydratase family protein [Armatimonadota bacterium]